ncbi:YchJ family protein [Lutibacter flavus]|uniref:SEC-C motif-containing protein n=1 Tax=Lutibacter flavus TaxID=691689 RepID=A0A238WZV1_9FLAO|nr:YchJ family metal-binding protein [Lutibacter flavus]SNR52185.1 SEC-C motif-containing protein [Lutibacter flavus]
MQCPCSIEKKYSDCCKKAHQNIGSVSSAEALMRSRYSAFVLANIEYLQKSHHSKTRPLKKEKRDIEKWTKSVKWLKLEVLNTTKDTTNDSTGTVEFKAFFMENGNINVIHENSKFVKENNHWVYVGAHD